MSTKSLSQNGYYKLPDGLLIQWGTGGNGVNQIVYFPTSFYNTSYVVVTTAISSVMNSIVKMINGKNISYFKVYSVGPTIEAGEIFGWIAIGNLGQNGYRKYEDGLLIQWGHLTNSSAGSATIWFPISFHDASYQFVTTMETVSNEHTLYTALPYNKSASYVNVMRKFLLADNSITVGSSTRSFDWIAIGR